LPFCNPCNELVQERRGYKQTRHVGKNLTYFWLDIE
jgi:hypothetical protein